MKKLFLPLCCLLLLFGCGKPQTKPNAVMFSCDFTARYQDVRLAGQLTRGQTGTLSLSLEEPRTLQGVNVSLQDGDLIVTLGTLRYTYHAEMQETAVLQRLSRVLDAVCETVVRNGKITGETDKDRYTVTVDPVSGNILSLELSEAELSIDFSNVKNTG